VFFAGFKQVSPGYLGDPYGCPRQIGKWILAFSEFELKFESAKAVKG
jgi:hypothetical protein